MRRGIDFPYLPGMGEERDIFSLPDMGEEGYICAIYLIWARRGIDLPFVPDMGRERLAIST